MLEIAQRTHVGAMLPLASDNDGGLIDVPLLKQIQCVGMAHNPVWYPADG